MTTYLHSSIHTTDYVSKHYDGVVDLEGASNERVHTLQERDEPSIFSGIALFDASTFEVTTEGQETLCILEGSATLLLDDTEKVDLRTGDLVVIPTGTLSRWTVKEPIKILFVVTP